MTVITRRTAIALGAACLAARPAWAAAPVKIGALLSFSGVYASIGEELANAMQLAFDQAGGAVEGRKLEIIRADTEVKPNVALAKARELVGSDAVDLLVGPVSSSESVPLRDFAAQNQMPIVMPHAALDSVTGDKCSPYVIRTSFSADQFAKPMGKWLMARGIKTLALMAPDYVGPRDLMDRFEREYVAAGGRVLRREFTPFGRTNDFGPYLARVKADKPDGLWVSYGGTEAINFIKQAADFRIQDSMKLTGTGWTVSPLVLPAEGDAAKGFIGLINYAPTLDTPANQRFQAEFRAKYGKGASEFGAQGYDTGLFILAALKATGGRTDDKRALANALRAASITGARGTIHIDPATNNIVQDMYIVEVRGGAAGPELAVIDTITGVADEPHGCVMPS